MLEKNKDYIEMLVSSTECTFTPDEAKISIDGYSYGSYWHLPDPDESYVIISKEKFDALQTENEQLKKKPHEFDPILDRFLKHNCGGSESVDAWISVSLFWKQKYETLSKLSGFSSIEEVQEYLTNNVECDTLHEAILKLRDEVTYTCEKLASANSENNSWKATAECNLPKELMAKLNLLRDSIKEWKEATCYPNPSSAKTAIESGASWCMAYNQVKKKYDQAIEIIGEWQRATGHFLPKVADEELAKLKKEVSDYKEQIKSLYKVIESWNKVTCCSTPEDAKDWVNELGEANGNLAQAVLSWQNVTGCSCPKDLSKKIVEWETVFTPHMSARDLCSAMSNAMESYKHKFAPWEEITGFSTPEKCSSYIDSLEKKLEDIKDLIEED